MELAKVGLEKVTVEPTNIPKHIAIIMDGNGRWAQQRNKPRVFGHKNGVESVRAVVRESAKAGVKMLTLFAFSSENWNRPQEEVSYLMELFLIALNQEVKKLHQNNIRLNIIGDTSVLSPKLQDTLQKSLEKTKDNQGLLLTVAVNYGGRWDIAQAAQKIAQQVTKGELAVDDVNEQTIADRLSLAGYPDPDLLIRTGGETRISNFLMWQSAYSELYFTEVLWPDFREPDLQQAMQSFAQRERRFGKTSSQVQQDASEPAC